MNYLFRSLCAVPLICWGAATSQAISLEIPTPPETRLLVRYQVPQGAPDSVEMQCEWAPPGTEDWRAPHVEPLLSETALTLASAQQRQAWWQGKVVEQRAAGLQRSLYWNPYPEAVSEGEVHARLRVTVNGAAQVVPVEAPMPQTYLEDWRQVLTQGEVREEAAPGHWQWQSGQEDLTLGNGLYGESVNDIPLKPLAYGLSLSGPHAIYVCTRPGYGVRVRLSGDERSDDISSRTRGEEVLWRVAKMDHQHLVLQQPHNHKGYSPAQVDYIKLVPLTEEQFVEWRSIYELPRDKFVAAYFEPYSWAFYEDVTSTLQHRQPLLPYAEASVSLVDIQVGRFGMKAVYETRLSDQLLYSTIGDPIGDEVQPTTDNVGKMQQYTNALDAELRYSAELGLKAHANFGASNCYVGTPLQGDFSKQHPEWVRGHALRLEVPEARAYALGLYRETLELGAPGISIDFCRYPEAVDGPEAATQVLREMRALANEYGGKRGKPVTVLVRFPGTGVRLAENFGYATWAREGLVDYLCSSNIQGPHMHIDIVPYLKAVEGTACKLLPAVDGLSWGLAWPGQLLWRVKQLYDAGAPGVYVYQADARLLGRPEDRRTMALLNSKAAVDAWWAREESLRPQRSKGIYITPPSELGKYHGWERIRVWLEGIEQGPMEALIDGQTVSKRDGPPYLVGTEDNDSDGLVPKGEHRLTIRTKDGDGWLEEVFTIDVE